MADSWIIRRAEVTDAESLAELAAQTFPLACPSWMDPSAIELHVRTRLSADAFLIMLAEGVHELTVATDDRGRAIGYLLLAEFDPGSNLLELRQIYTLPDYFGSGLADRLLDAALVRAEQRGAAGVWLGTSKQNIRAIGFYRRRGFVVTGERVFWVGGVPNDDWLMALRPGIVPKQGSS